MWMAPTLFDALYKNDSIVDPALNADQYSSQSSKAVVNNTQPTGCPVQGVEGGGAPPITMAKKYGSIISKLNPYKNEL